MSLLIRKSPKFLLLSSEPQESIKKVEKIEKENQI